nr:hypothetical protein [Desulfovibrio gilichinskyi]
MELFNLKAILTTGQLLQPIYLTQKDALRAEKQLRQFLTIY